MIAACKGIVRADPCDEIVDVTAGEYVGSITGAGVVVLPTGFCGTGRIGRWFRYQPTEPTFVRFTVCNAPFAKVLAITDACSSTLGSCVSGSRPCLTCDELVFAAPVFICVSGPAGSTGNFQLVITLLPNTQADICADANELPAPSAGHITFWADTRGAAHDGASSCDSATPLPDRWFRYTPAEDVLFSVRNILSATLSLHSGCPGTATNQLTCTPLSAGLVGAPLHAGTSYFIRVSARSTFFDASGVLEATALSGRTAGADALVPQVTQMRQFGRVEGVVACAPDSVMCNRGDEPLDCFANPDPRHPFIATNVYRLEAVTNRPGATPLEADRNQLGQACGWRGIRERVRIWVPLDRDFVSPSTRLL